MVECLSSAFDIFSAEAVNLSVERKWKRDFAPISAIQHGSPIEIFVPGTAQLYVDLYETQLYIRCQIVKGDGTACLTAAEVAPINNVLHSIFSSIEVEIGGKVISDPNGLYP